VIPDPVAHRAQEPVRKAAEKPFDVRTRFRNDRNQSRCGNAVLSGREEPTALEAADSYLCRRR